MPCLSEFFGRKIVYLVSWAVFTLFQIPVSRNTKTVIVRRLSVLIPQLAIPPNIATVLVCRYIQGFAGSCVLHRAEGHRSMLTRYSRLLHRAPLANTGGVVHDCFGIAEGGFAVGQSSSLATQCKQT